MGFEFKLVSYFSRFTMAETCATRKHSKNWLMSLLEGMRVSYNKRSLSNQKEVSEQCERFKVFLHIILSFTHWSLTPNWKDTNLTFDKTQIPSNRAINHFLQFFNFLPLYSESFLLLAARLSPQNFLMK